MNKVGVSGLPELLSFPKIFVVSVIPFSFLCCELF